MNNLRTIRKRLGMQQKELAQLIGRTQGNIGHYENREQRIPVEIGQKIVDFANSKGLLITLDDLYGNNEIGVIAPTKADIVNKKADVLSDAFGNRHLVLDGRIFITINCMPPYIDKVAVKNLAEKIALLINGNEGPE